MGILGVMEAFAQRQISSKKHPTAHAGTIPLQMETLTQTDSTNTENAKKMLIFLIFPERQSGGI